MVSEFTVPESGKPVRLLGPIVRALARALNGLRQLRFVEGDDWDFTWDEGGAVITYVSSDGGDGGDGLTVQTIDFCENGVAGTRQVRCGPFVPNNPGS